MDKLMRPERFAAKPNAPNSEKTVQTLETDIH